MDASDLQVVKLSGSPRERGRVHGEELRPLIHTHVERWLDWLGRSHAEAPRAYVDNLVTRTNFRPAIERWTPGLLDEVSGIAEGAAVDEAIIYGLQLPDEEWWVGMEGRLSARAQPGPMAQACSSVGVPPVHGRPAITAQNMDMPDYMDGLQVVLRLPAYGEGPEAYVFTVAGLIALNGVNRAGVGSSCNSLIELSHSADGLPVAYVHRGILAQPSLAAAEEFVRSVHHASGQNFLLGGPERVVTYECSANAVVEVQPPAGLSFCHTNHALANTDRLPNLADFAALPQSVRLSLVSSREDSEAQFGSAENRLHKGSGSRPPDVEAIKQVLSAHNSPLHPVCRHKNTGRPGWMTIGSTIMELGEPPAMYFAPGPPCSHEFHKLSFN